MLSTPLPPANGHGFWFSNRGDVIDTEMARSFDFTSQQGPLTLDFSLWFDMERDFDYGYVMASTDAGVSWVTLPGKYTTDTNPNGTNVGHGYTGASGGDSPAWVEESIDLSAYAGQAGPTALRLCDRRQLQRAGPGGR